MRYSNDYCFRCFTNFGIFAYGYYIDRYEEYQEMNENSKENSKYLVNDIKRKR